MATRTTVVAPAGEAAAPHSFAGALRAAGYGRLTRAAVTTLQVNVGRLCNLACHHCHVEAGPKQTETLTAEVAERIVELLDLNPGIQTVDLTGGAPEMNAHFRFLVTEARRRHRRVIDRCNLTIFGEPGYEDLPGFLATHEVHVVASLPCYTAANVDRQRGRGVFDASITALTHLNKLGYGRTGTSRRLDLVYNPLGPSLPPPQARLEAQYREELRRLFGIEFNQLLTIANMPIRRFADTLRRTGQHEAYMSLLVNHFNPATIAGLMCRSLISVGFDGRLYDCDFNQMLGLPIGAPGVTSIWDLTMVGGVTGSPIATGSHCFGCTAGAGSSCSGALS